MADQETVQKRLQSQYKNGPTCGIDKGCFWTGGILPPTPPPPPPVEDENVQQTWKLNGPLPPTPADSVDGEICFGFSGKINFVVADRRIAGDGGTSALDIKKNGVSILTAPITFTPADGSNVCKKGTLATSTFATFDKFTFDLLSAETGPARSATITVDATRTGP